MAATKRDKAALVTLLADNGAGAISAQDLRDFLESMDLSRGAYYWTAFATTTLVLQGTAVAGGTNRYKVLGTTVSKTLNRFTHASPNQLTYTGTPTIKADIFVQLCYELDTANNNLVFELQQNGAYLLGSYTHRRIAVANQPWQTVVMAETTLATGDIIEVVAANTSAAGAVLTPHAGYVNIQELPIG